MNRWAKGCLIGCGVTALLLVVAVVGVLSWARTTFSSPKPPDPKVGRFVALRPTFQMADGKTYSAGTAFAARMSPGSTPLLLTALHLLGTSGGLDRELAPAELDRQVRIIYLLPMGGRQPVGAARGALRKTGPTLPQDDLDIENDLAAFKLHPRSRVNALPLALRNPRLGEWVWVVGDRYDSQPPAQRLFPARVMSPAPNQMLVRFRDDFEVRGFSGAPLINQRGEVVGVLIGSGAGVRIGLANPVSNIRRLLSAEGVR